MFLFQILRDSIILSLPYQTIFPTRIEGEKYVTLLPQLFHSSLFFFFFLITVQADMTMDLRPVTPALNLGELIYSHGFKHF